LAAYLKALQPAMLVLAETEFWPNLLQWLLQARNSGGGGECADFGSKHGRGIGGCASCGGRF
jgi:hypothetical protein